jgi:3-deoxy-manno-octulosonate cytidylyltransferase (CMP-KDO synthetase)
MRAAVRTIAVIPARWESTRFPGKVLADLGGRPLVLWAVERAREVSEIDRVLVATDDPRVVRAMKDAGVECCMTSPDHRCGSERAAEAVRHQDCDVVVNLQGDEPFVQPAAIQAALRGLAGDKDAQVSTIATFTRDRERLADPNCVKVVCDSSGRALYFSRAPIPWNRDASACVGGCIHLGLYAFRHAYLLEFADADQGRLENDEKLEQLRILESGVGIRVVQGAWDAFGVDVPSDLDRARERLRREDGGVGDGRRRRPRSP